MVLRMSFSRNISVLLHGMVLTCLILAGCARPGGQKLLRLSPQAPTSEGVLASARILSDAQTKHLFGTRLDAKRFTAIQLYINNTSKVAYTLDQEHINAPLVPLHLISRAMHHNVIVRVAPFGLLTVLFWPFCIPATFLGMRAMDHNAAINRHVQELGFDPFDSFIIEPYSVLNRILFVRTDALPDILTLSLDPLDKADPITLNLAFSRSL